MREIRKLTKADLDGYREITYNAYPSLRDFSEEGIREYNISVMEIIENDHKVGFFGLFEDGRMISVMRLFDLEMNCFGKILPVDQNRALLRARKPGNQTRQRSTFVFT